jgi:hypothetical protein
MSQYPERMLLSIIGELFVHNRLLSEELEIKRELGREENENTQLDFTNDEGQGSRIGSEASDA